MSTPTNSPSLYLTQDQGTSLTVALVAALLPRDMVVAPLHTDMADTMKEDDIARVTLQESTETDQEEDIVSQDMTGIEVPTTVGKVLITCQHHATPARLMHVNSPPTAPRNLASGQMTDRGPWSTPMWRTRTLSLT